MMRRAATAAAALLFAFPALGAGLVLQGTETPIAVEPGDQYDPAIAGPYVVFTDASSSTTNEDIWYYDSADGSLHPAVVKPGSQQLADVSGSRIVYVDFASGNGDIWLYDIVGASDTQVTTSLADQLNPAVSGRLIAWEDWTTDGDVWIRDLALGGDRQITGAGQQSQPATSGAQVVYVDGSLGGAIELYDADANTTTAVFAGPGGSPDIDAGNVAYVDDSGADPDVAVWSSATGATVKLPLAGAQGNPHISGQWVAFEDGVPASTSHVALWHWTTGALYYPTPTTSSQWLNDISGQRVVYTDNRNGNLDVFAYDFQEVAASGGGGPVTCDDPSATVLATLDLTRGTGHPQAGLATFSLSHDEHVLVCMDMVHISAAWVELDDDAVATPNDFDPAVTHLERHAEAEEGTNTLGAIVAGKPGSELHIRVLANPGATDDGGEVEDGDVVHGPAGTAPGSNAPARGNPLPAPSNLTAASAAPGYGCSSGGAAGLFGLFALLLLAFARKPTRAPVPIRRK